MKLSNSENTVKCLHDKGSRGSRKKRLPKLLSLMLATVLIASAVVGDTGIGTVKAGTDVMMIIENANGSDNLEDYIPETGGMVLQKKDPKTGEWVDLEPGESVVLGNNYKLKVHFDGGLNGFKNPMHWNLGDSVTCEPKTGAPIWNGTTQIGTYDLDKDGNVTVYFYEDYLSGSNQVLDMEFYMVPTGNDEGGKDKFPWEGKIEGHGVVKNTGVLDVEKTAGYYSSSEGSIKYTVNATVTEGMIKNGKLKDTMKDGMTLKNIESMKVYDSEGHDVTSRYQAEIDALMAQAAEYVGKNNWELESLPTMSQGMRFEVVYKSLVPKDKQADKSYVAENTVTYSGQKPDGSDATPDSQTAQKPLAKDQLAKTGNIVYIGEGDNAEEVIQWQVRVGSGQWDPFGDNNSDLIMVDKLGDGLSFRQNENEKIHVQWCDKDGNVKGKYDIDWNAVTFSEGNKTATYHLKDSYFPDYSWVDGDYLMVTYNTDFDRNNQPKTGYENTVKNDVLAPNGTSGQLPVGEAIQKTVMDNEKEGYLTYTVVVDVPPRSHMKSMYNDSGDGHPELDLPYFYIQDELDFEGDNYFAYNVPNEVSIVAKGKKTGTEWIFENVPYTNGDGDPNLSKETETFQILQRPNSIESQNGRNLRAFLIYFNTAKYGLGTNGELDRHDSIWDIDEATQMTITYKIPYSTLIVDEDGKIVPGETLGSLLYKGENLKNKAKYRRSGVNLENSCWIEKNPQKGSIDKAAQYLGEGIVEYRVTFININDEDKENGRYIRQSTCEALDPCLYDTFDSRMEYVDDSLYVEVRRNDDNEILAKFKYKGEGGPVTDPSANKLSARFLDFTEQTWNDGEHYAGFNSKGEPKDNKNIKSTFSDQRKYVFVYKLKLKDQFRTDWEPDEDIKNTALFKFGENGFSDDTSIDIPYDMLQKEFEAVPGEGNMLKYTIEVNPLAIDLVKFETGNGAFINLNSYKLIDHMSDNLEFVTKAGGEYDITVEYYDKNVDGEGWKSLKRSSTTTGISKEALNYFVGSEENKDTYFILPDELYIRITYTVVVNGALNSQEIAENTATLYADHTETEEKTTIFEVGNSGATGSSDPTINLQKVDSETGDLLQGAEFALYSTAAAKSGESIDVTVEGEKISLYKLGSGYTYITDEFGGIHNIKHPAGEKNALYALVELQAPEGYEKTDSPIFFYFPDCEEPDYTAVIYNGESKNVSKTAKSETIRVENPRKEYLRIVKTDENGENLLEGAKFSLYKYNKDESGKWHKENAPLYTGTSVTGGVVQWDVASPPADWLDLEDGTYYLEETDAPLGYRSLEEPIIITVENGQVTASTMDGNPLIPIEEKVISNEKVTGFAMKYQIKNKKQLALRLIKQNMFANKFLPGAEFKLYADKSGSESEMGDCLWTGKSFGDGKVHWSSGDTEASVDDRDYINLSPGTYYLVETKAPENYNKMEERITVKVGEDGVNFEGNVEYFKLLESGDNGIIQYSILNPESYALPETGGSGNSILYLWAGLVLAFGCGMVLLSWKRSRRVG